MNQATRMHEENLKALGLAVIKAEAEAVSALAEKINDDFVLACQLMLKCQGRVVVTGMGKSGHIAGKIAATLASTGTPAFFVHPGEASHGDLGMITQQDVVLALSNSGETREVLTILPIIKRIDVPFIAMTGSLDSSLARFSTVHIDVSVKQEACPLGLAPTSSTTAALAMGDALAVAMLEVKGFTRDDFALSHPGGSLGKRLLLLVSDIMHSGEDVPSIMDFALVSDALLEMTEKKLGMTAVVNKNKQVSGVFTDGDLRRMLGKSLDIHATKVSEVMTHSCTMVRPDILAAEAMKVMQQKRINALLIIDDNNELVGALNMHDLVRAGIV